MKLQFLGADRQVTGSRYFLEAGGLRLLIDCGMFQERPFLDRNWAPTPVAPKSLDRVLLTHAHLDHSGLLPKLVKEGYGGPILTTSASVDLARLVMLDAARIQEEDAAAKQDRHQEAGRPSPHPTVPLYDVGDAERVLPLFHTVAYDQPVPLNDQVSVTWHDAGHILGSAMLELAVREKGTEQRLVFSGDLGLWDKPLIRDPSLLTRADYVVMESTYGDRDHDHGAPPIEEQLAVVVNETVKRGGNIVIPTFAIERAQELMYYFSKLVHEKRIPRLPVFLDSPMAVDATEIFTHHAECLDEEAVGLLRGQDSPFRFQGLVLAKTRDQSKAINALRGSCIIMAGSGMCTGGRIKHHLIHNITRPESTVLFVGYQGQGTLGRQILDGEKQVRILAQFLPVRAKVDAIHGLSAHADQSTLLRWLGAFNPAPRKLFLTHGEVTAAQALAGQIKQRMGLDAVIPDYQQVVELVEGGDAKEEMLAADKRRLTRMMRDSVRIA